MRKLLVQAIAALLLGTGGAACGLFTDNDDGDCQNFDPVIGCLDDQSKVIAVTMTNSSSQDVHLFVNSEDFPCCKVIPGNGRTVSFSQNVGGDINLRAGRNGAVLNTHHCKLSQAEFDAGQKQVSWNNNWSC